MKTFFTAFFLLLANLTFSQEENTHTLFVDGICGMCKDRIEAAAVGAPGVLEADWQIQERTLTVTVDPALYDELQLHWTITGVGHDTDQWSASDDTYNNLHACCKYRDEEIIRQHQPGEAMDDESETTIIRGLIREQVRRNKFEPIIGATVSWLGTGAGVVSNVDGEFELEPSEETDLLIISYVGFANDTVNTLGQKYIDIRLSEAVTLGEVEVRYRRRSTEISFIDPLKVQQIGSKELLKAACCNLAESFETNPAVDASVTDAVTGTRQIEMLGLAGPYVQISRENMPDIRGLSSLFGLTFTPGPWIQGIQLLKGPGSVVNGYESIAGQINVELKKPQAGEDFFFNFYANEGGRLEGNTNWRHQLNENWSTGFLLHGEYQQNDNDRNKDGFLDNSRKKDWIVINRWKWFSDSGWEGQFGIKGTFLDRQSGQQGFDPEATVGTSGLWGADLKTDRIEGWAKTGRVFPNRPHESIGIQLSAANHKQKGVFGNRMWNADQQSVYSNFIFQHLAPAGTTEFKTGLSFQYDDYKEHLDAAIFDRTEIVPGAFFEYTIKPNEKFTAVLGLRGDYHNSYGFFMTPRAFLRYSPNEDMVLRASAGQGHRTASLIAENIGFLASSRSLNIHQGDASLPYGLRQESAWNFGINWSQNIAIASRNILLSVDLYRTEFAEQVVVDYDQNAQEVHFYDLEGKSYSNSVQIQADYELLPGFDVRVAYRFNDVKTTYANNLLEKPLVGRHRAFINLGYETESAWSFDCTLNRQGSRRIPNTSANPDEFQLEDYSPSYFILNGQISKNWDEKLTFYVGGENLLDFVQENPILSSEQPFSPYFDSSLVWGPVFGRMIYVGMRYTFSKSSEG